MDRAAAALYRVLLMSYPRAFRDAHGADAASLFGEACQDDWSRGRAGALGRRLVAALATVPPEGIAERRAERRAARAGSAEVFGAGASAVIGDVRYAIRSIRRRPMLSATITATLAIGIGTNTAVFSRFLRALLYGLSPTDPVTLIGAPLLLLAIAVTALVVPAVRATRVDPLQVLRTD